MSRFDVFLWLCLAAYPLFLLATLFRAFVWEWWVDRRRREDEWSEYRPSVEELSTYPQDVLNTMRDHARGTLWAARKVDAAQRKKALRKAWDQSIESGDP